MTADAWTRKRPTVVEVSLLGYHRTKCPIVSAGGPKTRADDRPEKVRMMMRRIGWKEIHLLLNPEVMGGRINLESVAPGKNPEKKGEEEKKKSKNQFENRTGKLPYSQVEFFLG